MMLEVILILQIPGLRRCGQREQERKACFVIVCIDVIALREEVRVVGSTIRILNQRVKRKYLDRVRQHGLRNRSTHQPCAHWLNYSRSEIEPNTCSEGCRKLWLNVGNNLRKVPREDRKSTRLNSSHSQI